MKTTSDVIEYSLAKRALDFSMEKWRRKEKKGFSLSLIILKPQMHKSPKHILPVQDDSEQMPTWREAARGRRASRGTFFKDPVLFRAFYFNSCATNPFHETHLQCIHTHVHRIVREFSLTAFVSLLLLDQALSILLLVDTSQRSLLEPSPRSYCNLRRGK